MNFKVYFKGESGKGTAVKQAGRNLAPVEVQNIRNAFPHRLNIEDRIVRTIEPLNSTVSLTFSEKEAIEIPPFAEEVDGNVRVIVPDGYLNKFLAKEVLKNDANGYYAKFVVNENALLDAWKEAGYPTRWGFADEVNTVEETDFVGSKAID